MYSKKQFLRHQFFVFRKSGYSRRKARYWARATWPINRDIGIWAKENNEKNLQEFKKFYGIKND